ncbi:MAG TPA: hypothetical protein VF596_15710 [Pyrinomonadaceae bacterium]
MHYERDFNEQENEEDFYSQITFLIKENKQSWQSYGVVVAFGSGAFSIIAALICNLIAVVLTAGNEIHFFKRASFIFFALFLPLMMSGAHFLDLLEEKYFNF